MTQHLPKLPFTARCIANHSTFDLNLSATYKALFFPLSTLSATIYMFQIVLFSFLGECGIISSSCLFFFFLIAQNWKNCTV